MKSCDKHFNSHSVISYPSLSFHRSQSNTMNRSSKLHRVSITNRSYLGGDAGRNALKRDVIAAMAPPPPDEGMHSPSS
ncbi:hypothetical protein Lal_00044007 [Lupinus albus]|nr:hypothetical protein Lal_00044007 [Lupinus albus]